MVQSAAAFLAAHSFCAASRKSHGSLCRGGVACLKQLQAKLEEADVELAHPGEAGVRCTSCRAVVCGVENLYGHRTGKRCARRRGGGDPKLEECRAVAEFVAAHAGSSAGFMTEPCPASPTCGPEATTE